MENGKTAGYTTGQILKFVIPSLVGALAFIMPVPDKGTFNTAFGLLIDWGKGDPKAYLPTAAMTAVVLSAVLTVFLLPPFAWYSCM